MDQTDKGRVANARAPEINQTERIGKKEILEAAQILRKYKSGKANLERRVVDNEQWWKMRHWEMIRKGDDNRPAPEPASAWLFNSLANKHADAMDNYPEPSVLPRARDDEEAAGQLSAILPVLLEQNEYEQVYSDVWWRKLKTGTGVKGVFWNNDKQGGLGDVDIRNIDLLNIFWEPGITDIQDSRNLFVVELVDNDILREQHPDINPSGFPEMNVSSYIYDDSVDTSNKSLVVDWYYKLKAGARSVLHYCKFCGDTVLYASENDPAYAERGWYDHGKYPFVFDTLFPTEGTPTGFGYVDVMKDTQMYIDKLGAVILENALMAGRKRFFIRADGSINEEEFMDWSKPMVHCQGNLGEDSIREINVTALPNSSLAVMTSKIDELKETSGNRDFSQGGTSGGVTAASAIAALQEAGSKLSRDMIKSAYRAFVQECYLMIELMRQFYDAPRCFRITGEGGKQEFAEFDNSMLRPQPQGQDFGLDLGVRMPVFDIRVTAQKKTAFSTLAQNEQAKEFFGMGFFAPQMADQALGCLEMMSFEGKDKVMDRISQNGTMYQMILQMQQQMLQMAQVIDNQNGTALTQAVMQQAPGGGQGAPQEGGSSGIIQTNPLGEAVVRSKGTSADTAKSKAMNVSSPK